MVTNKTPVASRDSEATRTRILDAAARVLAEGGPAAFGVNAIAREAGCDKVLVYRYFGGLEALAEALGGRLDMWLDPAAPPPEALGRYGASMAHLLHTYLASLRGNALVRRILAWELIASDATVKALGAAKSAAVRRWFGGVRATAGTPPAGTDAPAVNAILLAAAHHLALRADTAGEFAGLDLTSAATWERIERTMGRMLNDAYPEAKESTP